MIVLFLMCEAEVFSYRETIHSKNFQLQVQMLVPNPILVTLFVFCLLQILLIFCWLILNIACFELSLIYSMTNPLPNP